MNVPVIQNIEPANAGNHPTVPYPHVLPQHPFTMGIVAPKGSGKTTLLCNMVMHLYKGYFHRVIVFSPTVENDPKWDVVKKTKHILKFNKRYYKLLKKIKKEEQKKVVFQVVNDVNTHKDGMDQQIQQMSKKYKESEGRIEPKLIYMIYTPEMLQDLLDEKQENVEYIRNNLDENEKEEAKYITSRDLWIFDDLVGSSLFTQSHSHNPFKILNIRHRHFSASIILVTQAYKEIPKTIRTNVTAFVLFRISNQKEIDVIYEECPCFFTKEKWMMLYERAIEEPYSFLYINLFFPPDKKMFKRFEYVLQTNSLTKRKKKINTC